MFFPLCLGIFAVNIDVQYQLTQAWVWVKEEQFYLHFLLVINNIIFLKEAYSI